MFNCSFTLNQMRIHMNYLKNGGFTKEQLEVVFECLYSDIDENILYIIIDPKFSVEKMKCLFEAANNNCPIQYIQLASRMNNIISVREALFNFEMLRLEIEKILLQWKKAFNIKETIKYSLNNNFVLTVESKVPIHIEYVTKLINELKIKLINIKPIPEDIEEESKEKPIEKPKEENNENQNSQYKESLKQDGILYKNKYVKKGTHHKYRVPYITHTQYIDDIKYTPKEYDEFVKYHNLRRIDMSNFDKEQIFYEAGIKEDTNYINTILKEFGF